MLLTEATMTDTLAWMKQLAPGAQLCPDSRRIEAGDLFIAYPGDSADGRRYIADAIARGAAGVLFEETPDFEWDASLSTPHLPLADLRRLAGPLAAAWYAYPDRELYTVAVTGTNGKTSCSQWLAAALSHIDGPAAVIGTLGAGLWTNGRSGEFETTGYTTPDAVQLQRLLSRLRQQQATSVAIEASSIGLEQGRMDGMHIDCALFTNLTRDHLDFHRSMEMYEAAKNKLFDWPGLKTAVVNLDDEAGLRLVRRLKGRAELKLVGYTTEGVQEEGLTILRATDIKSTQAGTGFTLHSPWGQGPVRTQLVGRFNVSNVLGIAGVLLARSGEWETTIDQIESLQPVPGRMQQLGGQDAPLVVIDYAHTPDALAKTLASLRQVANERGGKLWCLFGCGGDRDPGKRPQMGAMAELADSIVVTSDNPRSEAPAEIIRQIIAGMQKSPQAIEDRAAAILWAVRHAARADVVLLAGKGHENTQEIRGRKQPFMDADHAALALLSRATMKGNL
jgi:UDP-N-acetylmuramoyl-L-alanyl-D-glutamate--2,6-diaminopimelate ligase